MTLVTTLHSRRSQEIHEGEAEAHPPRAPVPRKARHARDPADVAQDGPRLSAGPGLGLADTDPDERADGARKPVYGPAAREEVRRILREAKREGINFGWFTKVSLCKVAKGERPLSYSVWDRAQAYVRRLRREREYEQDVRKRPMQFRLAPGKGLVVAWREGSLQASGKV